MPGELCFMFESGKDLSNLNPMIGQRIVGDIKAKPRKRRKHVVLPDALDERTIDAARIITDVEIASATLVGAAEEIRQKVEKLGRKQSGVPTADLEKSDQLNNFSHI
jgi:phosphotransacetylase